MRPTHGFYPVLCSRPCGTSSHIARRNYGIKEYDVFYFDPDMSWDAENAVIVRARNIFADVDAAIEVRNQARVHLWYEARFGAPYPPLTRTTDGIDLFLCTTHKWVFVRAAKAMKSMHRTGSRILRA